MKKLLLVSAVALAFASCATGLNIPQGAVLLGEREVDFKGDHDTIQVGKDQGFFRALFFVVENNGIELFNLEVVYGNGEREKFDTRLNFGEDSRSRLLRVEGTKRMIQSIIFNYKTVGSWLSGKARIVVYGVR
jgi:hypothetical protein